MKFANYDETGRIRFVGDVPESMIALQKGNIWVGEADPDADYIVGGERRERRPFPATVARTTVKADATDVLLVDGVPAGASLAMSGPVSFEGKIDIAGDVKLTFALQGSYELTLSLFPFLDLKVSIDAI